MTDSALSRRLALGRALREARQRAGLTQAEAAQGIGVSQPKIAKLENTLNSVRQDELARLVELYGLPEDLAVKLKTIAGEARTGGPRWAGASAYAELVDREAEAVEIRYWHSERLPAVLRSEGDNLRERRRTLEGPDGPVLRVILSEAALYRVPGGSRAAAAGQVAHLLTLLGAHDRLTVRILTYDADIAALDGDFVLLRFAEEHKDFVYLEHPGGARVVRTGEVLAATRQSWDRLQAAALSPHRSESMLRERLAALKSR